MVNEGGGAMSESYFDVNKIKTFEWAELNGKEMTLVYSSDGNIECLAGLDKLEGKIYILATKEKVKQC
jgi:uncharacterized protein with WD repeat